jgi:adenylate cyclase class 1
MDFLEHIRTNYKRFREFNDLRYKRFVDLIQDRMALRVIQILPGLFSVNHQKVPGFIDGNVPFGIQRCPADDKIREDLRSRFRLPGIPKPSESPVIEMLAVMGSVGTVAYNRGSDFDFWVCVDRSTLDNEAFNRFSRKVEAIQEWARKETKRDFHFFINDVNLIRQGLFADAEGEALGSASGSVLMDEFYRSSIIIAGKTPFWWVVPQTVPDREYQKMIDQVPEEEFRENFVDLGNLHQISREDFVGAALFQIIKSLGNPYKSIIKMGLLEKYLITEETNPLLSYRLKSSILREELTPHVLDSYLLMFDEVLEYYTAQEGEEERVEMLKENFYLKINPQLSRYEGLRKSRKLPYPVAIMFEYVEQWGWSNSRIRELDNFESWNYTRLIKFWNRVRRGMVNSYMRISSSFPNLSISSTMSGEDMKLLSRKIKSHFAPAENKIDDYITFRETPSESILYVDPAASEGIETRSWRLYKTVSDGKGFSEEVTLKTDSLLVKLLVWASVNQLYHPEFSRIKIKSGYRKIDEAFMIGLLGKTYRLFNQNVPPLKNDYFLQEAFTLQSLFIFDYAENNNGSLPWYHVYRNSWGESYIDRYESLRELPGVLKSVVKDAIGISAPRDHVLDVATPSGAGQVYRELSGLVLDGFQHVSIPEGYRRYVTSLGNGFITLCRQEEEVDSDIYINQVRLLSSLSLKPRSRIAYHFAGTDSRMKLLNFLYEQHRQGTLGVYYQEMKKYLFVFCINEEGNLFSFIRQAEGARGSLIIMFHFCRVVTQLIKKQGNAAPPVGFYRIESDAAGNLSLTNQSRRIRDFYLVHFKSEKEPLDSDNDVRGISARLVQDGDTLTYELKLPGQKPLQPSHLANLPELLNGRLIDLKGAERQIASLQLAGTTSNRTSTPYFLEKTRLEFVIERARR